MWIIDFGVNMPEETAALYELPFQHAVEHIKRTREGKKEVQATKRWWLLQRPRPEMRKALQPLARYILTSRVAKHRLFVWADKSILPDSRLYAIAKEDDAIFGILHSSVHEIWSLA